jgi:hypothetical protein
MWVKSQWHAQVMWAGSKWHVPAACHMHISHTCRLVTPWVNMCLFDMFCGLTAAAWTLCAVLQHSVPCRAVLCCAVLQTRLRRKYCRQTVWSQQQHARQSPCIGFQVLPRRERPPSSTRIQHRASLWHCLACASHAAHADCLLRLHLGLSAAGRSTYATGVG